MHNVFSRKRSKSHPTKAGGKGLSSKQKARNRTSSKPQPAPNHSPAAPQLDHPNCPPGGDPLKCSAPLKSAKPNTKSYKPPEPVVKDQAPPVIPNACQDNLLAIELLRLLEENQVFPDSKARGGKQAGGVPAVAPEPNVSQAKQQHLMEGKEAEQLLHEDDVIRNRWRIIKKLGGGGFGEIYEADDLTEACRVAVKTEVAEESKQVLKMEVAVIRRMQGGQHTCKFYGCGKTATFNFLVMSLCGRNLSELRRDSPQGYFSPSTAYRLVMQAIRAIQDLHNIGFLHRDVKPSNFAIGQSEETKRTVFLLDFGLARQYVNPMGEHRSPRISAGFRGTVRYASLAPHLNQEMSRIDDIWSLFYMLIEFVRGSLPWRKLRERHDVKKMKQELSNQYLVTGLPEEMLKFVESMETTSYYQAPEYDILYECLHSIVKKIPAELGDPFDWEMNYKNCRKYQSMVWGNEKARARKSGGANLRNISNLSLDPRFASSGIVLPAYLITIRKKTKRKSASTSKPTRIVVKQSAGLSKPKACTRKI